jgi:hypothetical protein
MLTYEERQPLEWFDSDADFKLVQRINRVLIVDDEIVWRSEPDSRMELEYGEYYKTDVRYNGVVDWAIDINTLAWELDVLEESANG